MLLARDSIVGISIPSSISLPASLFTRSVIHHPGTNSLVAMLARLKWCVLPRGPRDTSPTIGVTKPNLELCQPNMYLRKHLQSTFIITQLRCDVWYTQSTPTVSGSCTISWSKEKILEIGKALANETTRSFMICLGLGLVHHIILLMMWSRYQRHPMSMVRKP